jgi:acetolactate synthase small subunit
MDTQDPTDLETQEVRITVQITVNAPIEYTKEDLEKLFDCAAVKIYTGYLYWESHLEIISIEEEDELYNKEE